MLKYDEKIEKARKAIAEADAILIGAGAGLSEAAGVHNSGNDFQEAFADYIKKYGFTDLYTSGFYNFKTEEERWARWARHIEYAALSRGEMPLYKDLYELIKNKNYFIISTNVDRLFKKAGVPDDKIFEVQGAYEQMQCAKACHDTVYDNRFVVETINANAHDLTVDEKYVPVCPVCGGKMEPHLRVDRYFVEDDAWHKAADRYDGFLEKYADKRIVFMELGVGFNTPTIIRIPFERMTYANPEAILIRLNKNEPDCSPQIAGRTLSFNEDMTKVLNNLKKQ